VLVLSEFPSWPRRCTGNEGLAKQALVKKEEHEAGSLKLQKTWQSQHAATQKLKASLQTTKEKINEAKRKYTLMVAEYRTVATAKKVHESLSPTESPMTMMVNTVR
jgi:phage shock protein A